MRSKLPQKPERESPFDPVKNAIPSLHPPHRILLGPGPSDVPARVLQALSAPTVGHLDPVYLRIMDETRTMLQQVFRTENQLTLAVSGTGSAGMEACVANLIERGDDILEVVSQFSVVAVANAEKDTGEIVHGTFAAGTFADEAVGIQPDEGAFVIVIF